MVHVMLNFNNKFSNGDFIDYCKLSADWDWADGPNQLLHKQLSPQVVRALLRVNNLSFYYFINDFTPASGMRYPLATRLSKG